MPGRAVPAQIAPRRRQLSCRNTLVLVPHRSGLCYLHSNFLIGLTAQISVAAHSIFDLSCSMQDFFGAAFKKSVVLACGFSFSDGTPIWALCIGSTERATDLQEVQQFCCVVAIMVFMLVHQLSQCSESRGSSSLWCVEPLTAVASVVAEHRLWSRRLL